MSPEKVGIHCPTGLFSQQEAEIIFLTEKLNQAHTAAAKLPWAQDLMEAVATLLTCERYDEESMDCTLCRGFSELRSKAAELVVRAAHLHGHRGS
ncbi:MAG: hypothetical protein A2Y73_07345 [Chloroflexi bacterium RBG_13_56_8]|nr:MAG: hypothetical protein A2Y73_07345 [Chloroflexi bacterium RBG_13_56_8]